MGSDFDTLQGDVLRIPVVGIFAEANSVIDSPIFENVGAVGDHLAWFYPVISKFFDGIDGHRLQRRGSAEIQKERCRVLQAHLERLVIERFDADLREVRDLSFRKGLRILHVKELVVVAGGGLGRKRSFPRLDKVMGSKLPSVTPLRIRTDLESVGLSVLGNAPRFGHSRTGLSLGIEGG